MGSFEILDFLSDHRLVFKRVNLFKRRISRLLIDLHGRRERIPDIEELWTRLKLIGYQLELLLGRDSTEVKTFRQIVRTDIRDWHTTMALARRAVTAEEKAQVSQDIRLHHVPRHKSRMQQLETLVRFLVYHPMNRYRNEIKPWDAFLKETLARGEEENMRNLFMVIKDAKDMFTDPDDIQVLRRYATGEDTDHTKPFVPLGTQAKADGTSDSTFTGATDTTHSTGQAKNTGPTANGKSSRPKPRGKPGRTGGNGFDEDKETVRARARDMNRPDFILYEWEHTILPSMPTESFHPRSPDVEAHTVEELGLVHDVDSGKIKVSLKRFMGPVPPVPKALASRGFTLPVQTSQAGDKVLDKTTSQTGDQATSQTGTKVGPKFGNKFGPRFRARGKHATRESTDEESAEEDVFDDSVARDVQDTSGMRVVAPVAGFMDHIKGAAGKVTGGVRRLAGNVAGRASGFIGNAVTAAAVTRLGAGVGNVVNPEAAAAMWNNLGGHVTVFATAAAKLIGCFNMYLHVSRPLQEGFRTSGHITDAMDNWGFINNWDRLTSIENLDVFNWIMVSGTVLSLLTMYAPWLKNMVSVSCESVVDLLHTRRSNSFVGGSTEEVIQRGIANELWRRKAHHWLMHGTLILIPLGMDLAVAYTAHMFLGREWMRDTTHNGAPRQEISQMGLSEVVLTYGTNFWQGVSAAMRWVVPRAAYACLATPAFEAKGRGMFGNAWSYTRKIVLMAIPVFMTWCVLDTSGHVESTLNVVREINEVALPGRGPGGYKYVTRLHPVAFEQVYAQEKPPYLTAKGLGGWVNATVYRDIQGVTRPLPTEALSGLSHVSSRAPRQGWIPAFDGFVLLGDVWLSYLLPFLAPVMSGSAVAPTDAAQSIFQVVKEFLPSAAENEGKIRDTLLPDNPFPRGSDQPTSNNLFARYLMTIMADTALVTGEMLITLWQAFTTGPSNLPPEIITAMVALAKAKDETDKKREAVVKAQKAGRAQGLAVTLAKMDAEYEGSLVNRARSRRDQERASRALKRAYTDEKYASDELHSARKDQTVAGSQLEEAEEDESEALAKLTETLSLHRLGLGPGNAKTMNDIRKSIGLMCTLRPTAFSPIREALRQAMADDEKGEVPSPSTVGNGRNVETKRQEAVNTISVLDLLAPVLGVTPNPLSRVLPSNGPTPGPAGPQVPPRPPVPPNNVAPDQRTITAPSDITITSRDPVPTVSPATGVVLPRPSVTPKTVIAGAGTIGPLAPGAIFSTGVTTAPRVPPSPADYIHNPSSEQVLSELLGSLGALDEPESNAPTTTGTGKREGSSLMSPRESKQDGPSVRFARDALVVEPNGTMSVARDATMPISRDTMSISREAGKGQEPSPAHFPARLHVWQVLDKRVFQGLPVHLQRNVADLLKLIWRAGLVDKKGREFYPGTWIDLCQLFVFPATDRATLKVQLEMSDAVCLYLNQALHRGGLRGFRVCCSWIPPDPTSLAILASLVDSIGGTPPHPTGSSKVAGTQPPTLSRDEAMALGAVYQWSTTWRSATHDSERRKAHRQFRQMLPMDVYGTLRGLAARSLPR